MMNAENGKVRYMLRGQEKEEEAALFSYFANGQGLRVRSLNRLIIDQHQLPVGQVFSGFELLPFAMQVD